jgi:hypothetical protein
MIEKPKWVNIENINKLSYVSVISPRRGKWGGGNNEKDIA